MSDQEELCNNFVKSRRTLFVIFLLTNLISSSMIATVLYSFSFETCNTTACEKVTLNACKYWPLKKAAGAHESMTAPWTHVIFVLYEDDKQRAA